MIPIPCRVARELANRIRRPACSAPGWDRAHPAPLCPRRYTQHFGTPPAQPPAGCTDRISVSATAAVENKCPGVTRDVLRHSMIPSLRSPHRVLWRKTVSEEGCPPPLTRGNSHACSRTGGRPAGTPRAARTPGRAHVLTCTSLSECSGSTRPGARGRCECSLCWSWARSGMKSRAPTAAAS